MAETDHDILIEIRTTLRELVKCKNDHERRIRDIEISGSKEANAAIKRVDAIETRMDVVERVCAGDVAIESWWNSNLTQYGIVAGVIISLGAAVFEIYTRIFHGG